MKVVQKEDIRQEVISLKEKGFDYLSFITAVDKNENFEVIYLFRNLNENTEEFIKCIVSKDNPKIPTISDIFYGANWQEREVYDLFGIVFQDHPDLRRILLPEDYEGHPLRKDFPMHMEYEPYRSGDWLVNHEEKPPARRK
ncbi:MAG: NADH-quinone oxidoreductase subunit C [candidate division WOR-3 bacterium]|nr:NADH-quinone oxidoreductase subunit C [candidate division WOR-3 bacterium]MCX7947333.1 NADH-quinone oxidoreductase subunit C [candidate division WOR-3 bacterium]MDW8150111.1 NADH-quinone oxidoreductase subunit C [candidate division WOR-3 bacterium]